MRFFVMSLLWVLPGKVCNKRCHSALCCLGCHYLLQHMASSCAENSFITYQLSPFCPKPHALWHSALCVCHFSTFGHFLHWEEQLLMKLLQLAVVHTVIFTSQRPTLQLSSNEFMIILWLLRIVRQKWKSRFSAALSLVLLTQHQLTP